MQSGYKENISVQHSASTKTVQECDKGVIIHPYYIGNDCAYSQYSLQLVMVGLARIAQLMRSQ